MRFVHDRGSTPERRLPEMVGSGMAWLDYDRDGWMDLYVVQGGPFPPAGHAKAGDRLYRNNGDGTFTDVTEKAGLHDTSYGMGATAADYDNDGFVDLYVTNYGGNVLYHNNGNGTFTDVTARARVAGPRWGTSAAWGDIDGDGYLDLFVGQYADDRKDKDLFCGDRATGERDYCPPIMYDGTVSVLYRNNGDGTFTDITREAGLGKAVGKALGVLFLDYDLDGKPDIYIANDQVMNFLFHNLGGGRFEDVTVTSGTGFGLEGNPQGGMGVDAGDLDGDGLPDIVVANFESEPNEYYRNLGSGIFEDLSLSSGFGPPTLPYVKFGLNLLDVDNDGDLDAYMANGHIYDRPKRQGASAAQKPHAGLERRHGPLPVEGLRSGLRAGVRGPRLGRRRLRQRRRPGHRRVELGGPAPAAPQRRRARALARRRARRPQVQPPGCRRAARRGDAGGKEAHALRRGGLELPLVVGSEGALRAGGGDVDPEADDLLAVRDRAGRGKPVGREVRQDRGEGNPGSLTSLDSSRPFLTATADAISAPPNPATASVSASAASIERPGIQAWCTSSAVPQTASAPPTTRACSQENLRGPGQATAKESRKPSTP